MAESDVGGPSASQSGRRASQSPSAARRPSAAVPAPATASTGLSREKDIKMPITKREKLENAKREVQREKLSRPADPEPPHVTVGEAEAHQRSLLFATKEPKPEELGVGQITKEHWITKGFAFDTFPVLKMLYDAPLTPPPPLSEGLEDFLESGKLEFSEEEEAQVAALMRKILRRL